MTSIFPNVMKIKRGITGEIWGIDQSDLHWFFTGVLNNCYSWFDTCNRQYWPLCTWELIPVSQPPRQRVHVALWGTMCTCMCSDWRSHLLPVVFGMFKQLEGFYL